VVLGIDMSDKPHAIAEGLPLGKIFATGRAFVPFVGRSTFDKLATLVEGGVTIEARATSGAPPVYPLRDMFTTEAINTADALWSKVEVGSVVLAPNFALSLSEALVCATFCTIPSAGHSDQPSPSRAERPDEKTALRAGLTPRAARAVVVDRIRAWLRPVRLPAGEAQRDTLLRQRRPVSPGRAGRRSR
jgi:hypothetical protein